MAQGHYKALFKKAIFQFSAWDMETKFCVFRVYRRQTSFAAANFLHHLKMKFPFPIKVIRIEGWEYTYNHVRPHQELDYLTPYEYYRHWRKDQKTQMSLMP